MNNKSILFKNKYRIPSARANWWDYSSKGVYFITICTQDRIMHFGEIIGSEMHLNELGKIANQILQEIENQFDFIRLDEFVIMPNHVHVLLVISETRLIASEPNGFIASEAFVSEIENPRIILNGGFAKEKNPMFHKNISRVIRWYKGRCAFEIRKISPDFKWQGLYHDSIVFRKESIVKVQNYIKNNPKKWKGK